MQAVQVKMARAALGLSVDDLAGRTAVSARDVQSLEDGTSVDPAVTQALGLFFASSGIELIDGDGVRATSPESARSVTVEDLTTGNDGGQG